MTPPTMMAGIRLRASSANGRTFDFPDRPSPKALRKPVTVRARAIAPGPSRGPVYGRYPRSWMTLLPAGVAADGSDTGHPLGVGSGVRGAGLGRVGVGGVDVGEDVLDAAVVDLQADQTEAEVAGGVADQVTHVDRPLGGVDGDQ